MIMFDNHDDTNNDDDINCDARVQWCNDDDTDGSDYDDEYSDDDDEHDHDDGLDELF